MQYNSICAPMFDNAIRIFLLPKFMEYKYLLTIINDFVVNNIECITLATLVYSSSQVITIMSYNRQIPPNISARDYIVIPS